MRSPILAFALILAAAVAPAVATDDPCAGDHPDWAKCLGGDPPAGQHADVCTEPRVDTATCTAMPKLADHDACLNKVRAQKQCKPEKNPPTGASDGPVAIGSSQGTACDQLLRNGNGEYSAGKCVCNQGADGMWTCRIGD
jgi:hypothetical protein